MAQNRQIVVLVLDGNTGKPLVNQHLTVYAGDSPDAAIHRKISLQGVTNHLGLASLNLPPTAKWLQVWPDWQTLCQDNPKGNSSSVDEILSAGLAAPNTCSALVQKAGPGQFVVFARPPTLAEKLKH